MVADLIDLALEATQGHKDRRNYENKAKIVRAALGEVPADKLTPHDLRTWLEQHCKSPATFNRYKAFVSLCYRQGIEARKVTGNPARDLKQKHEPDGRIRFLSQAEYARLRDVIAAKWPEHLPSFVVSVQTGMRLGEQFTTTWGQVDLKRNLIHLTATKNGSKRDVYLNTEAAAAIETLRRPGVKAADRVFPAAAKYFEPRVWFAPALAEAHIDNYTWHSNRHTFCSWLAMSGASLKDIQSLAGHKAIAMSARYAHLSGDHQRSVVERLAGKLQHAPKHAPEEN